MKTGRRNKDHNGPTPHLLWWLRIRRDIMAAEVTPRSNGT